MPTIRAFCSVCNKDFTESLTESRDNYDAAEKKARGRAGGHMWGKHLADNPTWEEMSKAAWDALVQQLRGEASGVEGSSEGQPSQREIPPPRSLGGPEPDVAPARRIGHSSLAAASRRRALANLRQAAGLQPPAATGRRRSHESLYFVSTFFECFECFVCLDMSMLHTVGIA